MQLRYLFYTILLAVEYFATVYFTVSALAPSLSFHAAFIMAMGEVVIYTVLMLAERADEGLPVALLFLFPVTIVACGVGSWIVRLTVGGIR